MMMYKSVTVDSEGVIWPPLRSSVAFSALARLKAHLGCGMIKGLAEQECEGQREDRCDTGCGSWQADEVQAA